MPERLISSLISLVESIREDEAPAAATMGAKRMLLDSLGCAIAASRYQVPRIVASIATEESSSKPCTVIGSSGGTSTAEMASFANGVMIRYLDFNDTYIGRDGIGHPSDYIAAVLAAAEESGASGHTVLAGIRLIYEVFGRLTNAIPLGVDHFDHVTTGAIAAALGAGYVWNLTNAQLANAVALSTVPNVALIATRYGTVSMWKGCASGNACRNGIFAARLAAHGITGPSNPFEGRGGLCDALGVRVDWHELDAPGRPALVLESHLKQYPVGFLAQSAVDASLELRKLIPVEVEIAAVRVRTCEYARKVMAGEAQKWSPRTRETADHSLPFAVACALVRGSVSPASFDDAVLRDESINLVLGRLSVEEDPSSTALWPEGVLSRVTVTLGDGSQHTAEARHHRGHARNPMSESELIGKFRLQAEPVLGSHQSGEIIDSVMDLEHVQTRELLLQTGKVGRADEKA